MPQRPAIDADGQIDAAAENDERHPDREDRVDRDVLDQNRQIAGRQELGREHREDERRARRAR